MTVRRSNPHPIDLARLTRLVAAEFPCATPEVVRRTVELRVSMGPVNVGAAEADPATLGAQFLLGLAVLTEHGPAIRARLLAAFPRLDHTTHEDAWQDLAMVAVVQWKDFARALRDDGTDWAIGLLHTIGWRKLRARWRSAERVRVHGEADGFESFSSHDPGPAAIVEARLEFESRTARLCSQFGGRRPDALRAALIDTGNGFGRQEAADRAGISRESISRALSASRGTLSRDLEVRPRFSRRVGKVRPARQKPGAGSER
jgi:DNA-directed RNA polymerase specialized sigma24 family protein